MDEAETHLIPDSASGSRLDSWIAAVVGSRSAGARAIADGRVRVDGNVKPKSHLLRGGETVTIMTPPLPPESPESLPHEIKIVLRDEHLMVVEKPPGLVVHPAPGHATGTLAQMLAADLAGGEPGRAGIVHRLDQDTSGLLIVARTEAAHRQLREMLERREVRRSYDALVVGAPPTTEGTIDAPIGRDRRVRTKMSTSTDTPREARTHFEVTEAFAHATLLDVGLETGRTHQIRAHLAEIGLPVAGDPEYGVIGAFSLDRQFLHAARLEFVHPVTGEQLSLRSVIPQDLADALDRARSGEHPIRSGPQ